MDNRRSFSKILIEIVSSQGEDILTEARLMGWVQDLATGQFPLIPVLRNAIQAQVPQRLRDLADFDEDQRLVHIDNIALAFQDNFMLRPEAATYVVESFAYAMGYRDEEPEEFLIGEESEENPGEPVFVKEDDGEYCGYHKDRLRSGFGIFRKGDGSTYSGEWRLGMKMGLGLGFSSQHKRYAGQWSMNRQNGVGVEIREDGIRHVGLWKQGKADGWNLEVMPNGSSFCRFFQRGNPKQVLGACLFPNGDIVIGEIGPDGPNGKCQRIIGNSREVREETWSNGKKCF